MTDTTDIRWLQRLDNYSKAYKKLCIAAEKLQNVVTNQDEDTIELMREGLIQRFEYTHELAWNVMKDYETYQGYTDIRGSRDAIRKALATGIIDDPTWMATIADRNLTSYNYDESTAAEIQQTILIDYIPLFRQLLEKMIELAKITFKKVKTINPLSTKGFSFYAIAEISTSIWK